MIEQVEQHRLGPVQVVEHGDERPLGRDGLELPANLPEQVLRRGRPALGDPLERRRRDVTELHQHLDERPEGDPFAVVEAAAAHHRRLPLDVGEELGREARLADTRGAEEREEVAAPLVHGPLVRASHEVELAFPRYERHVEVAGDRHGRRVDGDEPVRRHGLGLSLQPERLDGLDLDSVADEPVASRRR